MAIYQLPTGTYETRAAFAVRGGSFRDKRRFAATAILVQHPKGDLLIDAGFGSGVAAHVAEPADTAFARCRKRHAKTDKTDSRDLRQLLAEGRLPECWIPPRHSSPTW